MAKPTDAQPEETVATPEVPAEAEPANETPVLMSSAPAPTTAPLTHRCPAHDRCFPTEDPRRPYNDFDVDPVTLDFRHNRACRRCVRYQRRERDRRVRGSSGMPTLERIAAARAEREQRLARLVDRGEGGSPEAAEQRGILAYLAEQERKYRAQADTESEPRLW